MSVHEKVRVQLKEETALEREEEGYYLSARARYYVTNSFNFYVAKGKANQLIFIKNRYIHI